VQSRRLKAILRVENKDLGALEKMRKNKKRVMKTVEGWGEKKPLTRSINVNASLRKSGTIGNGLNGRGGLGLEGTRERSRIWCNKKTPHPPSTTKPLDRTKKENRETQRGRCYGDQMGKHKKKKKNNWGKAATQQQKKLFVRGGGNNQSLRTSGSDRRSCKTTVRRQRRGLVGGENRRTET